MPDRLCSLPPQAVFLDRDGTVIEERHYLSDPAGVALLPGVGEALGRLCSAGCKLFLVSNQSGIGRGYFTGDALAACQARLDDLLRPYGARFTDARFCPHAPDADCACRKPGTGMWEALRGVHGLDPACCVMVGDKPEDLAFAVRARFAAAWLTLTGHGRESAKTLGLPPDSVDAALSGVRSDVFLSEDALKKAGYALPRPVTTALHPLPSLAALPDRLGL